MNVDPLPFPRTALAAQMVFIFEHRLQPAPTLFAPEQKGKTTFLQQDFIPLARQYGFLVAMADLLAYPGKPRAVYRDGSPRSCSRCAEPESTLGAGKWLGPLGEKG